MIAPSAELLKTVAERAGRIGVLMGGNSAEREISMQSGMAVVAALNRVGVEVAAVEWNGTLEQSFDRDFDRYFIAVHGRGGEDGQVQAVFDLMRIPYTGSGVLGCALAMDKVRAKLAWLGAGLPTPAFELVDEHSDISSVVSALGLPVVIKPAREGSSFGISKVELADDVSDAIAHALTFDSTVMAERCINGAEYTVSIVGQTALPIIRIETPRDFYDYEAKYLSDDTRYVCPCGLTQGEEQQAAALALKAFDVLDGHGWGRVDFICDADGEPWLIELNTVPGMTDHSLVPMAAENAGWSFDDLVLAIVASSMQPEELQ